MRRVGWRGESFRHSLAARGIKTSHGFFVFKDGVGALDKDSVRDLDREVRNRNVQRMIDFASSFLEHAEQSENMSSEWTERFMSDNFKSLADRYMSDPSYTRKQFKDDLVGELNSFVRLHSGRLRAFDWGDEK